MRSVLIVEDNVVHMEMLTKILKEIDMEITVYKASNQDEAYADTMKNRISLFLIDVVLDSKMPGDVSGMRFADRVRRMEEYKYTPMIFITGLEDVRLFAYSDLHCYYYLEKPYNADKAFKVIREALRVPQLKDRPHDVYFRKDGIIYKRNVNDVVYIENVRSGQTVYLNNDRLKLQYKPCKNILEELSSDRFIQCSRHLIVNKDYIDMIDTVNRYIRLKDDYGQIEIGITFKKKFLEALKES